MPSRVEEVRALLDLMKAQGISTLKVGDIELTMSPVIPEIEEPKYISPEKRELLQQRERRRISLAAGGRIVERASDE